MKKKLFRTVVLFAAVTLFFCSQTYSQQFNALLFTKTDGYHHESINDGVTAVKQLADRNFFTVEWHENAEVFNDKKLSEFDLIIFLSTTGNILTDDQKSAFTKFIQSGKGFVGIHSASDTEYEWDWYTKMVGRTFHIHPVIQTAVLDVQDYNFPGMERMPKSFYWTDEWYEFTEERIDGINYILTVDEKTFDPNVQWGEKIGKGMGDFHPISWYHKYDGGRAFYTALGHVPATFSDKLFMEHIFGGIYWAATGKGVK